MNIDKIRAELEKTQPAQAQAHAMERFCHVPESSKPNQAEESAQPGLLIDGVAYDVAPEVAAELLRLHLIILSAAVQEPVAWMKRNYSFDSTFRDYESMVTPETRVKQGFVPLYTSPPPAPQRTWVGLTEAMSKTLVQMAVEAGAIKRPNSLIFGFNDLRRFVASVLIDERDSCIALHDSEEVQAPVGNSAYDEALQEGWTQGTAAYREAIRARGNL